MSATVFTAAGYYVVEECCNCHMKFAMTNEYQEERRTNGGSFYCPAGHSQHYTEPKIQVLERQLLETKNRLESERSRHDQTRAQNRHLERSVSIRKGLYKRVKRKLAKGLCPRCHHHFPDVERHMQERHK